MNTEAAARDFLSTYNRSNEGFNEPQYHAYDAYTDKVHLAWKQWEDEITKPFWEAEVKPEAPTFLFWTKYAETADMEEDLMDIIKAFNF